MRKSSKKMLKKIAYVGIFILTALIFLNSVGKNNSSMPTQVPEENDDPIDQIVRPNDDIVVMSRLLTNATKKLGKLSCLFSTNDVSKNGGWCASISRPNSSYYYSEGKLAREIGRFLAGMSPGIVCFNYINVLYFRFFLSVLKGKRVASFGDGPGDYKRYIKALNVVKAYDAYDGAPFIEDTTNNEVSFLDLSVPVYHLSAYDWVMSVEVAEHIPREFESIYLENLVRHAREGIILSWARPGQVGHSHVNNRPVEYVKRQMRARGFKHDHAASSRLRSSAQAEWLRNNINVFYRVLNASTTQ